MNIPKIPFSISFFTNLTESFRIFLIGSVISFYGLLLYELFPELIFNPNLAISYFVVPMTILSFVGIGLPRLMPIILEKIFKRPVTGKSPRTEGVDSDDILNELVTEGTDQQLLQEGTPATMPSEIDSSLVTGDDATKDLDALIDKAVLAEKADQNIVGLDPDSLGRGSLGSLGEDNVRELIDQKFEPVEKDLTSFKKDLNKIKEDMKITKESVDTLTESFEGTLTDMKAFQAEISNPLNFMRKYFESIDLKSLQDPSLPLRQQLRDESVRLENPPIERKVLTVPEIGQSITHESVEVPTRPSTSGEVTPPAGQTPPTSPMDSVMKPLFSGNLSVGKMMSIVELAGEMLQEQGDDCIDLLLEQCKLMGLKPEDENTIYNIIDMLKNSGMKVDDSLIQLYKFSKIVGLNDPEADAHYSKLMTNRNREKLKTGE
jgi:hypothetical protein